MSTSKLMLSPFRARVWWGRNDYPTRFSTESRMKQRLERFHTKIEDSAHHLNICLIMAGRNHVVMGSQ